MCHSTSHMLKVDWKILGFKVVVDLKICFPKQCRFSDGKHWVLVNQTYTHLAEHGLQELFERLIFEKGTQETKGKKKKKKGKKYLMDLQGKHIAQSWKHVPFRFLNAVISQTSPCAGVQNFYDVDFVNNLSPPISVLLHGRAELPLCAVCRSLLPAPHVSRGCVGICKYRICKYFASDITFFGIQPYWL